MEENLHEWRLDIAFAENNSSPKSKGAPQTPEIQALEL
jgi:hypothetical protein